MFIELSIVLCGDLWPGSWLRLSQPGSFLNKHTAFVVSVFPPLSSSRPVRSGFCLKPGFTEVTMTSLAWHLYFYLTPLLHLAPLAVFLMPLSSVALSCNHAFLCSPFSRWIALSNYSSLSLFSACPLNVLFFRVLFLLFLVCPPGQSHFPLVVTSLLTAPKSICVHSLLCWAARPCGHLYVTYLNLMYQDWAPHLSPLFLLYSL